ncbi:MAG: amidohydrolase [Pseudomonadota bacterium]|nr:amidohydrolase [Pseudomonadota bacterium]
MQKIADQIIENGKIATLAPGDSMAEAIAITEDKILAVGSTSEVDFLSDENTTRIDAGGRLVTPGLIDAHAHMDREGLKGIPPSLAGCTSIDDILQRLEVLAGETPKGEWIVTMPIGEPPFYFGVPENLKENKFPNRHDLDRVAPDHPVYIRAIWGHWRNTLPLVSIANTKALEVAGIDRNTMPPAPSIQIERDLSTGDPSGVLYEFTYKPLVEKTLMKCIPQFDLHDRTWGLERSMQVYNSFGTTSVFEGHGIAGEVLAAYEAVRRKGLPSVRANLMFSPAWPNIQAEDVRDLLLDWGRWLGGRGMGDEYLRMAGFYSESDYSHENCLRAECGPYTGWAGFNFDSALPEDVMLELMIEAAKNGIRVGSFTENILDLYETVNKQAPIGDQRWLIEHIGMYTKDEIARIKDLGLVLQAYSNRWIHYEGESLRETHGAENVDRILPMRDLLDAGIHVALATDNVPPSMFDPIWHVVARKTAESDEPLGTAQALSRMEALACAAREGAWLSFEEDVKGTLEPGKYADIAILSDDLLTIPEDDIPNITSVLTMTGGRVVHNTLAA